MKVELYVVTSLLSKTEPNPELEQLKGELCNKFGGLTVIDNCTGYWLNQNKVLEYDNVQIWRILTNEVITAKTMMQYAERLKSVCKQKVQLFTIGDMPYYV